MELNHKKILVTFLMHLGDLTLTTPFIRALRQAAPDSHITMLTGSAAGSAGFTYHNAGG